LIWVCGLYAVLKASPSAEAQLASSADNGFAAGATGELGEAAAGLIRTDPHIDEKKKRRLMEVAVIDVLLSNFVM
jgi:hypothetical protein